jgi:predicted RNase H-like HicB family nuclease
MALTYLVVVESGTNNLSAYVPDIPGCVTTGHTISETLDNMREAMQVHLEGMIEDGDAIPAPSTQQVNLDPGDSIHHIAINILAQVTP